MADVYQFGGTNGVDKLDIGTPDSARYAANEARYRPNVIEGRAEVSRVVNPIPQQAETFVDNLGFAGQLIRFEGVLSVATDTVLAAVEGELSKFTTGQTITAGVRGPVVPSRMNATTLANAAGRPGARGRPPNQSTCGLRMIIRAPSRGPTYRPCAPCCICGY